MSRSDDDVIVESEVVDAELLDDDLPDDELVAEPRELDEADHLAEADIADDLTADDREQIVELFPKVVAERDEYLDLARRVQAEFENYKRRVDSQRVEQMARAAEQLVVELLPVLDACEAAIAHGATDVEPIWASLVNTLTKLGLTAIDEVEVPFDPNVHEAVMSEPGDGEHVVAGVLRTGFAWNGRVVRPAMVKVRG